MKICEYWRSRSFLDLCPRSCTYKKSKSIFLETTVPIWTKFCMKAFRYKEMKIWWHDAGHMIKMATTPIYGKKHSKNLHLWNRRADFHETWYVALRNPAHHSFFKWWPWSDDLFYGQVKFGNLPFYRKKWKEWIFQKLLQPMTWKVVGADI